MIRLEIRNFRSGNFQSHKGLKTMRASVLGIIITIVCIIGCGGGSGSNGGGDHADLPSPLGDIYPIDGVVDFSNFDQIYEQTVDMGATTGQTDGSTGCRYTTQAADTFVT